MLSHLEDKVIINRLEDYDDDGIPLAGDMFCKLCLKFESQRGEWRILGKDGSTGLSIDIQAFTVRLARVLISKASCQRGCNSERGAGTVICVEEERYAVLLENVWNTDAKDFAMGLGIG